MTLELNPEDVTPEYLRELRKSGFNRFSLGVQSFFTEDLRFLNRSHDGEQAIRAVRLLQEAGYNNISIDLIFGIPVSDDARWRKNLDMAFSLDVPHISAYALTVEGGTPLDWMIRHQRTDPVNDETQVNQFQLLMEMAKDHGFDHYEISNFAKPGQYAVHNTNYWKGVPYLGLGPSAHSYNGTSRRWNVSNLTRYLASVNRGELDYEEENLTTAQKYNEYVMTSLRTMWGCDPVTIRNSFGVVFEEYFLKNLNQFLEKQFVMENSGIYMLTGEGKLFADHIASELFLTGDQD
jgi:oxygen-independent coproporphyrinogen-3 oxidase